MRFNEPPHQILKNVLSKVIQSPKHTTVPHSLPSTKKYRSSLSTTFTADPELMIIQQSFKPVDCGCKQDASQLHRTYNNTKNKVFLFVFQLMQAKDSPCKRCC